MRQRRDSIYSGYKPGIKNQFYIQMTTEKDKPPRGSLFSRIKPQKKEKSSLDYGPIAPHLRRGATRSEEPVEPLGEFPAKKRKLSLWHKIFGKRRKSDNKNSPEFRPIAPHLMRSGPAKIVSEQTESGVMAKTRPKVSLWHWIFGKSAKKTESTVWDPETIDPGLIRKDGNIPALSNTEKPARQKIPWWRFIITPPRKQRRSKSTPLFVLPEDPEKIREKIRYGRVLVISLNSTMLYLAAYILVYLLYQLVVIYAANRFGISGVLYYYDVFWPIGDSSPLWFPYYRIILITGSGPFISLILGLLFFRFYVPRVKNPVTKLFFLWISLHALNMFFGAFVAGVTTNDGFGYVALWLYMGIIFRIILSFISLFALAVFGYHAANYFLETAPSPTYLKHEWRQEFLIFQALIPAILGAVIIILIRIPINPPYHIIILFTLFAAIIAALINDKARPGRVKSFPKNKGRKFMWAYFIVLVALMLFYRVVLSYGLHIIIKISMTVSFFGDPNL